MVAAIAVAAVIGLLGHQNDAAPSLPVVEHRTGTPGDLFDSEAAAPAGDSTALRGRVREVINVAAYTYLRLATAQGEVWAAVSKAPISVDSDVAIDNPTPIENFESTTLKRTFELIYFGNLAADGGGDAALPPGHPSIEGATAPTHPHADPGASGAVANLPEVNVARAAGSNARTVGELFAAGSKLEGRRVRIRGQVVKVTSGVLGKTYLRLRDGSGSRPEERELVLTTATEARVGDVATFEGTLRAQVDVGIGYKYAVLVEDAKIVAEPAANAL